MELTDVGDWLIAHLYEKKQLAIFSKGISFR